MLSQLEAALKLSQQLEDSSHDADIWGEMADTYADLGDFEKAAKVKDFYICSLQSLRLHTGPFICPACPIFRKSRHNISPRAPRICREYTQAFDRLDCNDYAS